jgi:hypothetical protein
MVRVNKSLLLAHAKELGTEAYDFVVAAFGKALNEYLQGFLGHVHFLSLHRSTSVNQKDENVLF